jgi:curved DNA-binding protein CbpA
MLSDRVLAENLDRIDYYTLLGVARDAPLAQIRDAFHKFAIRFHPDQHVDDVDTQQRVLKIFKRGSEGYRVLLDPVLRTRYDAALGRGESRLTPDTERVKVVGEAKVSAVAEQPLPPDVQPLYLQISESLRRGDVKNAKAFLTLLGRKSNHPKVQALAKDVLEAEKNLLRRR